MRLFFTTLTVLHLAATLSWGAGISLTWVDGVTGETGFQVQRGPTQFGPFQPIVTTGANSTTYVDSGLASGQYCYRVLGANGSFLSSPSNVSCQILSPISGSPSDLTTTIVP
jgi:hypothetical protein